MQDTLKVRKPKKRETSTTYLMQNGVVIDESTGEQVALYRAVASGHLKLKTVGHWDGWEMLP